MYIRNQSNLIMTEYLSYNFKDTQDFVETYDELPLWSAPFGLLLLKHLEYKPGLSILDIGSGAGFPLMEIAARFGKSCICYGLDIWTNANNRARKKIKNYELNNVQILEGSAEKIPFENNSIDLIVSNLGINNFENPLVVFGECSRILKANGLLALTTNLNGHWKEFYEIFEITVRQIGKEHLIGDLKNQQAHRGTVESISKLFTMNGFTVRRHFVESFEMKFLDGSAFLNHHFVKLGWLKSWTNLLIHEDAEQIFALLEQNLNLAAGKTGGLLLTVPMAFIEGRKK